MEEEYEMSDTPLRRAKQREEMRRQERQRKMIIIRNVMNIIFMLMAIVGMGFYFFGDKYTGTIIILAAMGVKMVESCLRMLRL